MRKHLIFVGYVLVAGFMFAVTAFGAEYQATYQCEQHRYLSRLGPFAWQFPMRGTDKSLTGSRLYIVAAGTDQGTAKIANFVGMIQNGQAEFAVSGANFHGTFTGKMEGDTAKLFGPMLNNRNVSVRNCYLTVRRA